MSSIQIFQPGGGGVTPGGSDTQVQFNNGGAFGGDSGLTFDATNNALTVGGATVTTSKPVLDLSQTWNAGAVTFIGIKFNVTNTASAAASLLLDLQVGGTSQFKVDRSGNVTLSQGNTSNLYFYSNVNVGAIKTDSTNYGLILSASVNNDFWFIDTRFMMTSDKYIGWASGTNAVAGADTIISRVGAGVVGVRGAGTTTGGALNFLEQTAPSAPSANQVVLYAEDNGSGKTRLMARFNTGAAQQVAIEP